MAFKIAVNTSSNYQDIAGLGIFSYRIIGIDSIWQTFRYLAQKYFNIGYEKGTFKKVCFQKDFLEENYKAIYKKFGNSFAVIFSERRYFIMVIEKDSLKKIIPGEFNYFVGAANTSKNFNILIKTPNTAKI